MSSGGHLPPFLRQQALAVNRLIRPEDSISNVSASSWNMVQTPDDEDDLPPADLELPHVIDLDNKVKTGQSSASSQVKAPQTEAQAKAPPVEATKDPAEAQAPEPTPDVPNMQESAQTQVPAQGGQQQSAQPAPASVPTAPNVAPATQAAQNFLAGTNPQYGSRKLCKQAERAAWKGARALRFGQMGGLHNALSAALPPYLRQVGAADGERSILVVDSRDQRISSPFQGWLLDEILVNAQAGVNVLSDARQVRSPSTGYHMNLFYMRTLEGKKLIVVGSMTSYGSVPCGKWDSHTGDVMSHKAFQPFRWPLMRDDSATWVDLKLKVEGALLLHLEMRGYRSDRDMTVQVNYINDALVMGLEEVLFIPSCTVVVFQGWRVCAVSYEVGGQLYACGEGGAVLALDFPLCHFEARLTSVSSADSLGLDADRLEFRFNSAQDRLDVACETLSVPATWLVVSRVSAPTLVKNARWCREHFARVEGPDQVMQLSQIAGIHAHWTAEVVAESIEQTGPRIGAVDVSSRADNLHLTCESPLFRSEKKVVPKESIALQYHDPATERAAMILPPTMGTPAIAAAQQKWEAVRDLAGPRSAPSGVAGDIRGGHVSLTPPGQAASSASSAPVVFAPRRPLEQRRSETIADAAVTPMAFCGPSSSSDVGAPSSHSESRTTLNGDDHTGGGRESS
ncbi:Tristetraprolin [Durusdinium trenchii]|uniref:Tristetraprolin n=1 Tax=Durusdinium trenchii TaxID=1381693 RepID=A0ABP0S2T3_9DINO